MNLLGTIFLPSLKVLIRFRFKNTLKKSEFYEFLSANYKVYKYDLKKYFVYILFANIFPYWFEINLETFRGKFKVKKKENVWLCLRCVLNRDKLEEYVVEELKHRGC